MIVKNGHISKIVVQCQSRFVSIDVETSVTEVLLEAVVGKAVPVSLYPVGSEILLSFHSNSLLPSPFLVRIAHLLTCSLALL